MPKGISDPIIDPVSNTDSFFSLVTSSDAEFWNTERTFPKTIPQMVPPINPYNIEKSRAKAHMFPTNTHMVIA